MKWSQESVPKSSYSDFPNKPVERATPSCNDGSRLSVNSSPEHYAG